MIETRIPVSVITGFLGAGKTTLLNRLLCDPAMADSAVIINEFGEIGLDHLIVATPAENTVLLQNGCLCCTVKGELTATLKDLFVRRADGSFPRFARVLVETTGLADPAPILQSLLGDDEISSAYRLASVITVVDAANGACQLDTVLEMVKQVAMGDRIIVSKSDLVDEAQIAALEAHLSAINPDAVLTRAVRGCASADEFMADGLSLRARPDMAIPSTSAVKTDHRMPEFRHGDVSTFSLEWATPATEAGLHAWLHLLTSFRGPDLLRVKGIVNVEGRPVLVNAVQSLIHEPLDLPEWPCGDRLSRMVFITRGIDSEPLKATLAALEYRHVQQSGSLDPQRYGRFLELVAAFRVPSGSSAPKASTALPESEEM